MDKSDFLGDARDGPFALDEQFFRLLGLSRSRREGNVRSRCYGYLLLIQLRMSIAELKRPCLF